MKSQISNRRKIILKSSSHKTAFIEKVQKYNSSLRVVLHFRSIIVSSDVRDRPKSDTEEESHSDYDPNTPLMIIPWIVHHETDGIGFHAFSLIGLKKGKECGWVVVFRIKPRFIG